MDRLLIGFDSAWTAHNAGAIVAALQKSDGSIEELGEPQRASFEDAAALIGQWQGRYSPAATLVLLDQPTIVPNASGQRPVENLVSSAVSRRLGGMQPAYTAREAMFGRGAPVWPFLQRFGGAANPLQPLTGDAVLETYPVLTLIALEAMMPAARPSGRLPKYNPAVRKSFARADWEHVCRLVARELRAQGLSKLPDWADALASAGSPRKADQDALDACLCLMVALRLAQGQPGLMVGDVESGYIVVPHSQALHAELDARCHASGRPPDNWVRAFSLSAGEVPPEATQTVDASPVPAGDARPLPVKGERPQDNNSAGAASDTQVTELLGRNRLVDELLRAGLEVALPIRDRGVDLIAYVDLESKVSAFVARPVQMKAASRAGFSLYRKYERIAGLILAYVWHLNSANPPVTYALYYDEALAVAEAMGWTATRSWTEKGAYVTSRPSEALRALLEPYEMTPERWWRKVTGSPRGSLPPQS